jgi:hypothetical protein
VRLGSDRPLRYPSAMRLGRSLRFLMLAVLLALGLAGGAERPAGAPADAGSVVSTPSQSIPGPVHDEATCAFCQAATFPPCSSRPAGVGLDTQRAVRHEPPRPEPRLPRLTARGTVSSRAPPLRIA